jgi:hypothetical protein
MGALLNNRVWITNKVELQVKDLSPRDWFETKVSAVQIGCTHALLVTLSEEGEVSMLALVANPNPQNNILMSDNFLML